MMPELDFESDQFLTLLTEALRAGPGSPEWHDAVGRLTSATSVEPRLRDVKNANEYQLLIRARQDLESGREYRAVRAGPGFTRRLMQTIDDGGGAQRQVTPVTTWIAMFSGAILVIAAGFIIYLIVRGSGPLPA